MRAQEHTVCSVVRSYTRANGVDAADVGDRVPDWKGELSRAEKGINACLSLSSFRLGYHPLYTLH